MQLRALRMMFVQLSDFTISRLIFRAFSNSSLTIVAPFIIQIDFLLFSPKFFIFVSLSIRFYLPVLSESSVSLHFSIIHVSWLFLALIYFPTFFFYPLRLFALLFSSTFLVKYFLISSLSIIFPLLSLLLQCSKS